MMKILLSNDDGVNAPGLAELARSIAPYAEITVVAPDRDRSAASNSLTLDLPLRITKQANSFYAVNGTPTDSVHLAITGWLEQHPDMIMAGINAGSNLGDDVLYSGTVAAAMEGRFLGYPAIAISLTCRDKEHAYYETAGKFAQLLLEQIQKQPLPKDTILNVNVPNRQWHNIQGVKVTRLGQRHLAESVLTSEDPRGNPIYWFGAAGKEQDAGPGTDFHAINQGYISITPLKIDLTDYEALESIGRWSTGFKFG